MRGFWNDAIAVAMLTTVVQGAIAVQGRAPVMLPAPARAVGGGRPRGVRTPTGVNTDPLKQPNEVLRALNREPTVNGPREEVYCTKVGTTHPDEMYIVAAHVDGHGWGEAANDDGSGTALVMELTRIFSMPDVQTERATRFALWNNEETGLNGAGAYVEQRQGLQGQEQPAGSGRYPEPRWLGMIQHDMMLFDHGMPRADGSIPPEQRPEADVNIEFQMTAAQTLGAQALAWYLHGANEKYATDYPAQVSPHMTNTDSTPFMDLVPAISVRENERGADDAWSGGGVDGRDAALADKSPPYSPGARRASSVRNADCLLLSGCYQRGSWRRPPRPPPKPPPLPPRPPPPPAPKPPERTSCGRASFTVN